ncbi:MAG: repA [Noviherbaspirillum sp.]|nr:repA [Noviherbaspirillum sp.]
MFQAQFMAGQAVACARFLPAPLIAARAAAFNPTNCLDLNQTARRVLYGALTFLNLRSPRKAIFPRRETLRAESLLQSDPTLYRGLKTLEEKGYITRDQSRNARTGKFYLSPITFTEKALVMLELDQVIHKIPSSKMRDGHIKKELTKDEQSLQNTAGEPDSAEPKAIDRRSGLPMELLPLLALDVRKSAVCWLMQQARRHGKRLGDVLRTVRHRVDGLRGREVVSYLKAMIMKNLDYAWIAKTRIREEHAHMRESQANQLLASLDSRYHGFEVRSRDGTVQGIFDASEAGLHVIRSANGCTPVNLRFARAYAEGDVLLQPKRHASPGDGDWI